MDRTGKTRAARGHDGTAGDAPAFLPERAFVVQIKTDAGVASGSLTGRVEHVVSGEATGFESSDELLAFLSAVLSTSERVKRKERPCAQGKR